MTTALPSSTVSRAASRTQLTAVILLKKALPSASLRAAVSLAHVELATAAAEAKLLAAARDLCAPHVTKSEADRADSLVHKHQPGRALKVLMAPPLADTSDPAVLHKLRELHPQAEDD